MYEHALSRKRKTSSTFFSLKVANRKKVLEKKWENQFRSEKGF
jgi:hypothetical protein